MEESKKSLEEKSKEFFKSRTDFNCGGFNPAKMNNLCEHMREIGYLIERNYIQGIGDTVVEFRYVSTVKGRKWANS